MVGYITINREELKVKDLAMYQAFYCGVCQDIKKKFGQVPRLSLSYEMTFLAMLLSSIYDERPKAARLKCLLHPIERRVYASNKFTSYAADMCIITAYHNLMDNWEDEQSRKSFVMAELIKKSYEKAARQHPRQTKAVMNCIRETRKAEASKNYDLDLVAGLTGHMVKELFIFQEDDMLGPDLARLGFFLGKFIYLMDAYDDLESDKKSDAYNPFIPVSKDENFEKIAKEALTMMASEAAMAFERLPAIDYIDIFRNVLYSGMWAKYYQIQKEKGRAHCADGKKVNERQATKEK